MKAADGTVINDTRLTVPGHYTPHDLTTVFRTWIRFATLDEVREDGKWYRFAEVPTTFLIGTSHASRIAVSNLPIGCEGAEVTAIVQQCKPSVVWEERELDTDVLHAVSTPTTPSPSSLAAT